MHWRVDVSCRKSYDDPVAQSVLEDIRHLGVVSVQNVRVSRIFFISGELSRAQMERIADELLTDPITEEWAVYDAAPPWNESNARLVEVFRKPGVMDPVEASTLKGVEDMGLRAESVHTGTRYVLEGGVTDEEVERVAAKLLYNDCIEYALIDQPFFETSRETPDYVFELIEIDLLSADDETLMEISRSRQLSLNLAEMKTIQEYFRSKGRNPTDVELETLAQTWSEHCVHKTLKGKIEFDGEIIDNLLASTIARCTQELNKPWCVSVFKDNAGVIEFDEKHDVCFKVETHNHPSAIEPYGGAGTGIGGVIRDPLGTGLGAKPILNTDVFCFGPPDMPNDRVPPGALHPLRVMKGVVAGVRDYGNRMGIPTCNGAVYFDERYTGNPLVYCGNVGLMEKGKAFKKVTPGSAVVVVGGRTGRDGIHGATFSSAELTHESESVSSGAVQIGNAITEKKLVDVILAARDRNLYEAITDCGAGGLSSAVGEMGEETGCVVDLDKVPLKYEGLSYTEIWISEAQERMVLSVPKENLQELLDLCASEDVEAVAIGEFTDTRRCVLRYQGRVVCDIEMEFLHEGVPQLVRKAVWTPPPKRSVAPLSDENYGETLRKILSSGNVCSKEWIIRQYDHEVQGASVLKPLLGAANDGPGDAAVVAPVYGSFKGIAVACGMNPRYGDLDPYRMAASAIDEAVRQIIAVGGDLDRIALLDNFCWGNTDKPDRLGSLVLAAKACYDIGVAYGAPFISGKDSLNNEFRIGDEVIVIPPSLLISSIGVIDDVRRCVSMDAKEEGDAVYVVGRTWNELGGSHYCLVHGMEGGEVPQVRTDDAVRTFRALSKAIRDGLVRACHDCSEGGLAAALAETAFAGGKGMDVDLAEVPCSEDARRDATLLFSESNSRFVVEVKKGAEADFEKTLAGVAFGRVGSVTDSRRLCVKGIEGGIVLDESIDELKRSWQKPLF